MKEVESAGSFQNLTDSENEKNFEEIHHADQNTGLKITGDSNSKEESPSGNETEKKEEGTTLPSDKSTQTDIIDTKDVFTETSDENVEHLNPAFIDQRDSTDSRGLRKDDVSEAKVNSKDLYHKLLGSKIKKRGNYRCYICLKYFASNFSKKRHIKRFHEALEKGNMSVPLDKSNSASINEGEKNLKGNKRKHANECTYNAKKILKSQAPKRKSYDNSYNIPEKRKRLTQGIKQTGE